MGDVSFTTLPSVDPSRLVLLRDTLTPLIGVRFDGLLRLSKTLVESFEPSQIGTIVGTLIDGCIPRLDEVCHIGSVGLSKRRGEIGSREGYPDYEHVLGLRVELKLIYVAPLNFSVKSGRTHREPSARLAQHVTVKNVIASDDVLLLIAYQLQEHEGVVSPTIIDFDVFPVIDCVIARDLRLINSGGRWFGDYEVPAILSRRGRGKKANNQIVDTSVYGRKESENRDFNEDTNFGKMSRIPYPPLQLFLKYYGY